ncbi:MAG: class I SAM-dependent methyltransferase [Nocardioidaceae bacterium]
MSGQERPRTRWEQIAGSASGADYAQRFEELAAAGNDVHGEATFCEALLAPGSRVLDAGCGTGRVAVRLAALGHRVTGTDVDASMLAVARCASTDVTWVHGDLADLPAETGGPFDLVVLAGNVVPLLAEGTLADTVRGLAGTLAAAGLLVAGFGLDAGHLPQDCPVTPLEEYDAALAGAGLRLVDRFATWERTPYDAAAGYAVSVHGWS